MGNNSKTINMNIDFLQKDLKLIKQGNTSIFIKNKYFIISPAINNDFNWFDLRKINLDKFNNKMKEGYLLIRLREKFILLNLEEVICKLVDYDKYIYTKSIGQHWKFNVLEDSSSILIKSRSDSSKVITSRFYNNDELINIFNTKQ